MDASCYSKVVTGDGTDDYFAYRRLGSVASDDDEFYTRTKVRLLRVAEGGCTGVHRGAEGTQGEVGGGGRRRCMLRTVLRLIRR